MQSTSAHRPEQQPESAAVVFEAGAAILDNWGIEALATWLFLHATKSPHTGRATGDAKKLAAAIKGRSHETGKRWLRDRCDEGLATGTIEPGRNGGYDLAPLSEAGVIALTSGAPHAVAADPQRYMSLDPKGSRSDQTVTLSLLVPGETQETHIPGSCEVTQDVQADQEGRNQEGDAAKRSRSGAFVNLSQRDAEAAQLAELQREIAWKQAPNLRGSAPVPVDPEPPMARIVARAVNRFTTATQRTPEEFAAQVNALAERIRAAADAVESDPTRELSEFYIREIAQLTCEEEIPLHPTKKSSQCVDRILRYAESGRDYKSKPITSAGYLRTAFDQLCVKHGLPIVRKPTSGTPRRTRSPRAPRGP